MTKKLATGLFALCVLPLAGGASNLIENGDFESGDSDVFYTEPRENLTRFEGSPVSGDEGNTHCAAVTLTGFRGMVYSTLKLEVDPSKKYRMSAKVFADVPVQFTMGGNASDVANKQVVGEDGAVWGYRLVPEDGTGVPDLPAEGWTLMQTTFGPPGSGAEVEWNPEIVNINFGIWISPGDPGRMFLDDVTFTEIE